MSTSLILLMKATALLVLALGLTRIVRRAPASARYLVWLATLVALLMVPAISAWSPLPLRVLPSERANIAAAPRPPVHDPGASSTVATDALAGAPSLADSVGVHLDSVTLVLFVWLSGVAILLGWLALGAFKIRRVVRRANSVTGESWLDALYETADRLDLDEAPRLVTSDQVEMPFACGIVRPTVVLPANAEEWNDERRRVVLLHELAHIRRRDLIGHTVGRVVCAVYWFHPMVWSAAKQLRAEGERACDDLVLASGARASDYANHLLDIVINVRRHAAPALALPMANKREFEGRMIAILDPDVRRTAPKRAQRLMVTVGFGALSLSIMAVAPVRRVDDTALLVGAPIVARAPAQSSQTFRTTEKGAENKTSSTEKPVVVTMVSRATRAPQTIERAEVQSREPADTAMLGPILRMDKSAEVRRSVGWQLQGRREGVPLLLERLENDPSWRVREIAAWGLAGFASDHVTFALADALRDDKSAYVRATAAWALGHTRSDRTDALEGALDDEYPDVRRKALWALAQSGVSAAPPGAVAALRDPAADVRAMAAWLLTEIADKSTMPALREAFFAEHDQEAAKLEFRALALMGDKSKEVIERAAASKDPIVRARGIRMLAGEGVGMWMLPLPWPDIRVQP